MNILLVGGSGFIGGVVRRKLAEQGHHVTIFDIAEPAPPFLGDYVQGDIRDGAALSKALVGKDIVVNLAAVHRDDVRPISLYDEVNVLGAQVLCDAMTAAGIHRLVFTSSVAIYGEHPFPMNEDCPRGYFNDYGRTKHLAEGVYTEWQGRDSGNRLTIIRPTVVFGLGNRGNVYNLLKQIKSGTFMMVGSGKNRKSLAHVENIAGFILHMLDAPEAIGTYNYADKPDLDMNQLVRFLTQALGKKPSGLRIPLPAGLAVGHVADVVSRLSGRTLPISSVRVRKFCMSSEIDSSKAMSTGYQPSVNLQDGLKEMITKGV